MSEMANILITVRSDIRCFLLFLGGRERCQRKLNRTVYLGLEGWVVICISRGNTCTDGIMDILKFDSTGLLKMNPLALMWQGL